MRAFEFHFNPKSKEGFIFESFCFEPENIYEKRVGGLYMVGLLKNVLPKNIRFVDALARVIKENYYRLTIRGPEKALKESLKEANKFLEGIAKKGDVSWLGNLSFVILSCKNFILNFTKVGEAKILLLRGGKIIDIDKRLNFQDIEPYPLKIFGNIVTGKLAVADLILVLTKEVFEIFQDQNLLPEIANILPFDEKKFKLAIQNKEKELLQISGICLAVLLTKEEIRKRREIFSAELKKVFSAKETLTPVLNFFKKFVKKPKILDVKAPKLKLPSLKFPSLKFPRFSMPTPKKLSFLPDKRKALILALILFLFFGFLLFQREKELKTKEYEANLNKIQAKYSQAENFLKLKEQNLPVPQQAYFLLEESWKELLPLKEVAPKLPQDLREKISVLESKISKGLYESSNLKEVLEPKVFFDFGSVNFIPQKIVISKGGSEAKALLPPKGELYFFNSASQNLFLVKKEGQGDLIETEKYFDLAGNFDNSILFFSKPKQLTIFKNGEFFTTSLVEPYSDFNFDELFLYNSNLYFLDKKSMEVIKYPYFTDFNWGSPQLWLAPQEKKALEIRSIAVDGSLWILEKNNSISRYYAGKKQETLKLNLFPSPQNFSKILILPGLPYLYILEPEQKRIIVLNKKGEIIKQFRSEKFDNLLDFAVSEDGKIIYLLNSLKVYQIKF